MRVFFIKLAILVFVAGLLTAGLVFGGKAEEPALSYTLADAARDAAWRTATAQRLKELAIEADARRQK